ncbi:DNA-processing protein DprA [Pontibacillus litoralis]|uniref:Smf/DprA SLOG domain-containing protein n=1 Tax=Pontibacillus litoralis JSM 072002 TaxID=1385512 RepID=A0A0A5GBG2_9BACI|nr:DNA-processing protein DprA [Pontibacillus litoralis]KGX88460.1 hypothetical protein N784_07275 [Pontibacillus litoralis JSM 072002]
MELQSFRLCHLHVSVQGNRRILRTLLHNDPQLEEPYRWTLSQWMKACSISYEKARKILDMLHQKQAKKQTLYYMQTQQLISMFDPHFPSSLRHIPDPPFVLYIRGHINLLHNISLSVVGTRKPSKRAYPNMKHILQPVIENKCVIVSGLALGIDTYAHKLAIETGGKTIGVLAFGFNHCYPLENHYLMQEMSEDHLLLSEYPPNTRPQKWHFPERNRIISGISFATFVVEAKERSGSLITADQALDQGKEVYAMPGDVSSILSVGCHKLIQQGAKLVQNTRDIMEDFVAEQEKQRRIMSE